MLRTLPRQQRRVIRTGWLWQKKRLGAVRPAAAAYSATIIILIVIRAAAFDLFDTVSFHLQGGKGKAPLFAAKWKQIDLARLKGTVWMV
ncbi:MAG: hypothetical protein OHK0022_24230 [Roseiflexaceae bacterium]